MEKITGKNNEIIKGVKKLLSSSKQRRIDCLFVLEGARLVFDVLNSSFEVKYFFITESALDKYKSSADQMSSISERAFIISDDVAGKLSETQSSQGVFAVCKMKNQSLTLNDGGMYIALDNVQDPGNLGTIIRTAEALGINGIIVGGGCDIYNPKVLRASMGSVLRMTVTSCDNLANELLNAKDNGFRLYATSPDENALKITSIDFSNGGICIIGNEANGISDEIKNISDELVTIPMLGRAESLNASVAAAITMWEMLR